MLGLSTRIGEEDDNIEDRAERATNRGSLQAPRVLDLGRICSLLYSRSSKYGNVPFGRRFVSIGDSYDILLS
ncbi:hypothetical protein KCU61_g763, partial [Aureobasidium melanogenum]